MEYNKIKEARDERPKKGRTTMKNNEFTKENANEWTELDHVYLVQDEPISGTGDYFEKAFRTLEEANDDAREQWHYLTDRERKQRHIWVFRVDREDLDQSIANEDLPIDWKAYGCSGSTEGCFDSAEGK